MTEPLEQMIRREGGRVLATLVRLVGSIDIAEDAVQDATVDALRRWPVDGVPSNPAAWLTTAARNRVLDFVRREAKRGTKEADARLLDEMTLAVGEKTSDSMVRDDLLRLLFTCCHPALAIESRLALALRTLCGMTTGEIAAVFLVPESTMGQRISRAKRKIASARIPYRIPADHELPDRLPGVLQVVHAVVTAGHHAPEGRLDARTDLAVEGVRLARLLTELMPDEPECTGLLPTSRSPTGRRSPASTAPSKGWWRRLSFVSIAPSQSLTPWMRPPASRCSTKSVPSICRRSRTGICTGVRAESYWLDLVTVLRRRRRLIVHSSVNQTRAIASSYCSAGT